MEGNPEMFESLYGHRPDQSEPSEFKVYKKVAAALLAKAESYGHAVIRQVAIIANQNGIDVRPETGHLQYIFFLFNENYHAWPAMAPNLKSSLLMGRWIMHQKGVPNYPQGLVVPPVNIESNVDATIMALAKWCRDVLRSDLAGDYINILKANVKSYDRAVNGWFHRTGPEGPPLVKLLNAVESWMYDHPLAIPDGAHVNRLLKFIAI